MTEYAVRIGHFYFLRVFPFAFAAAAIASILKQTLVRHIYRIRHVAGYTVQIRADIRFKRGFCFLYAFCVRMQRIIEYFVNRTLDRKSTRLNSSHIH